VFAGFCGIADPALIIYGGLQVDHGGTQSKSARFIFNGAQHPIRSFHDSPLHV
jgi:hypothetical protein